MSSVNKVILVGNLGKAPELKYTQSGTAFCRLSLATKEQWTDQKGQKQEKVEWHNVTVWKKLAENTAKYCGKGSSIYVEGRLETRSWEENGQKRYATDVVAETVKFLGGGRQGREESPPAESRSRARRPLNVPDKMGDGDLGDIPY
ncbi:single-stranded DNA-binding protein [Oligoflexus tunisiensis]|uniref:single-stranded DNA-binding protein n=1 Tax=Oligoflexus tunisiensis TaxID=708132 RepID=UPI000ABA662A|nr:single-stranded DNA-binding protein [Oligoflexus tunisiensis]